MNLSAVSQQYTTSKQVIKFTLPENQLYSLSHSPAILFLLLLHSSHHLTLTLDRNTQQPTQLATMSPNRLWLESINNVVYRRTFNPNIDFVGPSGNFYMECVA